jgi:phosphoserine phosphatase
VALRAILFDLDDTLMPEEGPRVTAFANTCALVQERHGIDADAFIDFARTNGRRLAKLAPARAYLDRIEAGSSDLLTCTFDGDGERAALQAWLAEYRQRFWCEALEAFDVADAALVDEVIATFDQQRHAHHRLYDGAREVLEGLHGEYALVLVTNGPSSHQRRKVDAVGIADYFDALTVSGDIGIGKPAPEMFRAALDAAQVTAEEAVMVGNNLARDIGGAEVLGIRGVWACYPGETRNSDAIPWRTIADVCQLPAVIADA